MVTEQLTLHFGWGDSFSFANYYPGGNEAALYCVQQAAAGEGEHVVMLWGAAGSGKSHVLQAACQEAAEAGRTVAYLPLLELADYGVEMLEGLENMGLVCIDDLQCVAGRRHWEDALFHLYNRMRETGNTLLVGADASPAALAIELPDLRSRLAWGPVFQLAELDDQAKLAVLRRRAAARGFELPAEVALYLLRRSARDMASLLALLDKLDEQSLVQQRKLTIPFVRNLL